MLKYYSASTDTIILLVIPSISLRSISYVPRVFMGWGRMIFFLSIAYPASASASEIFPPVTDPKTFPFCPAFILTVKVLPFMEVCGRFFLI